MRSHAWRTFFPGEEGRGPGLTSTCVGGTPGGSTGATSHHAPASIVESRALRHGDRRLGHDRDAIDDTPDVIIDLDRVRANIERAATQARDAGIRLRPHAKTHKMVEIARMQIDAGASGLQVAKLGEAEVFAAAGVDDLFVADRLVGAKKAERLRALDGDVSVAVDSLDTARAVADAGRELRA